MKGKGWNLTSDFLGYERVIWWNLPDHWNLGEISVRAGEEELWMNGDQNIAVIWVVTLVRQMIITDIQIQIKRSSRYGPE